MSLFYGIDGKQKQWKTKNHHSDVHQCYEDLIFDIIMNGKSKWFFQQKFSSISIKSFNNCLGIISFIVYWFKDQTFEHRPIIILWAQEKKNFSNFISQFDPKFH